MRCAHRDLNVMLWFWYGLGLSSSSMDFFIGFIFSIIDRCTRGVSSVGSSFGVWWCEDAEESEGRSRPLRWRRGLCWVLPKPPRRRSGSTSNATGASSPRFPPMWQDRDDNVHLLAHEVQIGATSVGSGHGRWEHSLESSDVLFCWTMLRCQTTRWSMSPWPGPCWETTSHQSEGDRGR
jgi:hypothetical protein